MPVHVLDSPIDITDGGGSFATRRRFKPYGAELGGQVKDGLGFAGHVGRAASRLCYMRQWHMDSQLGIFLAQLQVSH